MRLERALKLKERLTSDLAWLDHRSWELRDRDAVPAHRKLPRRAALRARIAKCDAAIEAAGLFPPPGTTMWTPDGYIEGFAKMPGANAGYRGGRNLCRGCEVHYTVGRDSTSIGLRGTFLILLPKVWPPKMFAPFDAVTYHGCEHNSYLLGVETEKMGDWEETTPDQIRGWAYIIAALREKGLCLPFGYHDGDHDQWPPGDYSATYVSHRSCRQRACDQHQDYLEDWAMAQAHQLSLSLGSGSALAGGDDMGSLARINFDERVWFVRGDVRSVVPGTSRDAKPKAPYSEVINQLVDLGMIPRPPTLAEAFGRLIGPATLAMFREQPWDWTSLPR